MSDEMNFYVINIVKYLNGLFFRDQVNLSPSLVVTLCAICQGCLTFPLKRGTQRVAGGSSFS
jgi:hypothetical protein